jgi:SAM-dependent methyltransferase
MYGRAVNVVAVSMLDVLAYVEAELARGAQTIELDVLDPDVAVGQYAGETVEASVSGAQMIHRPLRVWLDLAERLRLRLRTPRPIDPPLLRLTFEPLRENGVGLQFPESEKYGTSSWFARVQKLEDPRFVIDLREALDRVMEALSNAGAPVGTTTDDRAHVGTATDHDLAHVGTNDPIRVLDLGVNTGDELALMLRLVGLRDATFVGVDHSASAVAVARERFASNANVRFVEADIMQLAEQGLGRFDLVVCIGTMQSGALDDRELLRRIVQDHLAPGGAVILGMPNCRYVDGELEYGARIVNITQPELGLLVKDVAFYRKYLQQHHKRVFVTGKHYIFVTAIAS